MFCLAHCVTYFNHMRFLYAALLISFLLVGCSEPSTEPREDELTLISPPLILIEDSDFSHDALGELGWKV